MRVNYNNWFHKYNQYLTATRGDNVDYNDTNWVAINQRMKVLQDLNSDLITDQPFGVVGNKTGFSHLIDLLAKSNYSFEDIDESLIKSYKNTLQSSMGRMMVNTHAIIFHCTNKDSKYVSYDQLTGYYVLDVPFDQLHFGERDEFIRQKLQDMHVTEKDNYIPLSRFVTSEICDILGFSIMCTVNGYICNDCMIALDDKGLKFKLIWLYSGSNTSTGNLEFVIYKLDTFRTHIVTVPKDYIVNTKRIPLSVMGLTDIYKGSTIKCIVDIYNPDYIRTAPVFPNFGNINSEGLTIVNTQQATIKSFDTHKSDTLNVIIYEMKYMFEIPNAYPATNYYNVLDERRVYTEDASGVVDYTDSNVVSSADISHHDMRVCTPPIVIDRDSSLSFNTIKICAILYNELMKFDSEFKSIGVALQGKELYKKFYADVKGPCLRMYPTLKSYYDTYVKGAVLTSLISNKLINKFKTLVDKVNDMKEETNYANAQKHVIDEYYTDNYHAFVKEITAPFTTDAFAVFKALNNVPSNFYNINTSEQARRFNRPISEQCFMSLKYDTLTNAWLFAYPQIEHFKGIGNTFYIKNDLKGDEIFKFFIFYTDTENPFELYSDPLTLEEAYDFDKFYDEVSRHQGYIRYWNAENKLMKLSKILYNKYDDNGVTQVLGKILANDISAEEVINEYESELKYDRAGTTTCDWNKYTESSLGAPFTINYLFYTLSMIHDNEDKMEAYFMRTLVDKNYRRRYVDINISEAIDKSITVPVNYSHYSVAPNSLDIQHSSIPVSNTIAAFYGTPYVVKDNGISNSNPYRYTFNRYYDDKQYPLISQSEINVNGYLSWTDVSAHSGKDVIYNYDVKVAKLVAKYLTYSYQCIGDIQTNYTKAYDVRYIIDAYKASLKTVTTELHKLIDDDVPFSNPETENVINEILEENDFITEIDDIYNKLESISLAYYNGRKVKIRTLIDDTVKMIRRVFKQTGFDNNAIRRVKRLYNQLKEYNSIINIEQLKTWWDSLDKKMLKNLSKVIAQNKYFNESISAIEAYNTFITMYYVGHIATIYALSNKFSQDFVTKYWDTHFKSLAEYCSDVYKNNIFDMYAIGECTIHSTLTYAEEPYLVVVSTGTSDHFKSPQDTSVSTGTLVFKAVSEYDSSNKWKLTDIIPVCEYCVFKDTKLTSLTAIVYTRNGTTSGSITVDLEFVKAGSSAGQDIDFDIIPSISLTSISFKNDFENVKLVGSNIASEKRADMNFEMLFGNKYIQLDHDDEYVLDPETYEEHSTEIVRVPNKLINGLLRQDNVETINPLVYFKPAYVLHIPIPESKKINSVFGKCFVGKTIYLQSTDGECIFPCKVTVIDHSEARGFIEVEVDSYHSKWFSTNVQSVINKYLYQTIECKVLDDNIGNFLTEYSNPNYLSYTIPNSDYNNADAPESLPGDPVYVSNNQKYIYSRLNYFFHEDIPNRFFNDETKSWEFMYLGEVVGKKPTSSGDTDTADIIIRLINREHLDVTTPELYPILRSEPDDHNVWADERETYTGYIETLSKEVMTLRSQINELIKELNETEDVNKQLAIRNEIDSLYRKIDRLELRIKQIANYKDQPEQPTTWYNVHSYDSAQLYIDSDRVYSNPIYIIDKRDVPITEQVSIFLYDWEHKTWINPSTYRTRVIYENSQLDAKDDYTTQNIATKLEVIPLDGWIDSTSIFVYVAYNKSDIYESIQMNTNKCYTRFKPIISASATNNSKPYDSILIRKHFNGEEKYTFSAYNASTSTSFTKNGLYVKRLPNNSKILETPALRMCDLSLINGNTTISYENVKLYVKIPFDDVKSPVKYKTPGYMTAVNTPIENFVENEKVKLICISNNNRSFYDGNVSSVMFEASTKFSTAGTQLLTITKSSLDDFVAGTYICTVFQSNDYKSYGGIVTVIVTTTDSDLISTDGGWMQIPPTESAYKILPEEFIVTANGLSFDNKTVTVQLKNDYAQTIDDEIVIENTGKNPYEFYFNTKENIRYPISDVRANNPHDRFEIDLDMNPNIKVAKMTYIGISRYAAIEIPKNGVIDVTGYIPTPLSRDRYEWWVNGRFILPENIIILSPTSFQLKNLRSLKNFELIELVDDVHNSDLMKEGTVYTDVNGNMYSSYTAALASQANILNQELKYVFNAANHTKMHDYTRSISGDPNNIDVEDNILTTIEQDESEDIKYNELHNVPSLNGITIYNMKTSTMGIEEMSMDDIIKVYDSVWNEEIVTNPLFPMTHKQSIASTDNIILHKRSADSIGMTGFDAGNTFVVYASGISESFFTLYISKSANGKIDSTTDTVKIIPFIRVGVYVLVDKKYEGYWLHCTESNVQSIKL